ncbi:MAG: SDR family oxidoreductase [Chloroflexota bacterium]
MYRDPTLIPGFSPIFAPYSFTPLRKYAKHEEIANAALFLASSGSSHTTGESLNVTVGRLMS